MKTYDEYIEEARKKNKPQMEKDIEASNKLYDTQIGQVEQTYGDAIKDTEAGYETAYKKNEVQRIYNERAAARRNAELGLTDSGKNLTDQLVVQTTYSNNKSNIDLQKQNAVDTLASTMRAKITELKMGKESAKSSIESNYESAAQENATNLYSADLENERETQKAKTNAYNTLISSLKSGDIKIATKQLDAWEYINTWHSDLSADEKQNLYDTTFKPYIESSPSLDSKEAEEKQTKYNNAKATLKDQLSSEKFTVSRKIEMINDFISEYLPNASKEDKEEFYNSCVYIVNTSPSVDSKRAEEYQANFTKEENNLKSQLGDTSINPDYKTLLINDFVNKYGAGLTDEQKQQQVQYYAQFIQNNDTNTGGTGTKTQTGGTSTGTKTGTTNSDNDAKKERKKARSTLVSTISSSSLTKDQKRQYIYDYINDYFDEDATEEITAELTALGVYAGMQYDELAYPDREAARVTLESNLKSNELKPTEKKQLIRSYIFNFYYGQPDADAEISRLADLSGLTVAFINGDEDEFGNKTLGVPKPTSVKSTINNYLGTDEARKEKFRK